MSDSRPWLTVVLVVVLLFQAVSALAGGIALLADPSGRLLRMPLALLARTPFQDYFAPGVMLVTVLGLAPLLVAFGLWRRPVWRAAARLNPWRRYHWAWSGAVLVGIALLVWIGVQIMLIGYVSRLQPLYGLIGALIIRLALTPPLKRWYARA